jgi:O-antigen/teichoic acid export membrane protein
MVRVLTEYLSPAEYGYLTLGLTVSLISNQLIFGPLGAGVTRFFAAASDQNEVTAYLRAVTTLTKQAILLVTVLTGIGLIALVSLELTQWAVLLVIGMMFSLATGFYTLANGIFLAKNSQIELSLFQISEPISKLAIAILFIIFIGSNSTAALGGYIVGTLMIFTWQYFKLRKIPTRSATNTSAAKEKWQNSIRYYGLPYASWGLFTALHLASDRWVLNSTQGPDQVGLYATLYQLGYLPVTMLVSVFSQVITPHLYKIAGEGIDNHNQDKILLIIKRAVIASIGVTIIFATFAYIFHGLIYEWFVSEKFASVSLYMPLVVIAGGLFASGQILMLSLQSRNTSTSQIPIKIGCAVIGILLNIILGSMFGVAGMVIAQASYSIIYFGWVWRASVLN